MSPDHGSSRSRRGVWTHWVPLAVTVTVATVGAAAWVWSQRKDEDDETERGLDYGDHSLARDNKAFGSRDVDHKGATSRDIKGSEKSDRPEEQSHGIGPADDDPNNAGWGARMSGALRRTPSPQQFFDSTGKTVAAGVAAAGAAMEADAKQEMERSPNAGPSSSVVGGKRRKTVAIVVSADSQTTIEEMETFHEHASILSHIPRHNDFSQFKLFVLIYAPGLKEASNETGANTLPPASLSSSFSNIGPEQIHTPAEESKNPLSPSNPVYNSIYSEALTLVEKETMIIPFTTSNGHAHILRHLQPEVIYLEESLSGSEGSTITTLQSWLRHDVILVVGADGGSGGLADSESEAERAGKHDQWWQRTERVGRGRGIVVVDSMRLTDDWLRRVQNQD